MMDGPVLNLRIEILWTSLPWEPKKTMIAASDFGTVDAASTDWQLLHDRGRFRYLLLLSFFAYLVGLMLFDSRLLCRVYTNNSHWEFPKENTLDRLDFIVKGTEFLEFQRQVAFQKGKCCGGSRCHFLKQVCWFIVQSR
jgi:hypothetical protein